jgi:hypothetical protein
MQPCPEHADPTGSGSPISTRFSGLPAAVATRGQVTFRKDVLRHLGIRPGEKIELDKPPYERVNRTGRPMVPFLYNRWQIADTKTRVYLRLVVSC